MAATRFAVHVDKENATPAANFSKPTAGSVKTFGPQKGGKSFHQPTPRKALFDVNRIAVSELPGREKLGAQSKKENIFNPVKPAISINVDAENKAPGLSVKKNAQVKVIDGCQKVAHGHTKQKSSVKPAPPKKTPKVQEEEDEDGYDSDTIFPRAQRLSTYVDKLFTWRPPCLFGVLPDTDSEVSDDDLKAEDFVLEDLDLPACLPEVPVMTDSDLPCPFDDLIAKPSCLEVDSPSDASLTLTPDTSLTFGSLKVMNNSVQTTDEEQD